MEQAGNKGVWEEAFEFRVGRQAVKDHALTKKRKAST